MDCIRAAAQDGSPQDALRRMWGKAESSQTTPAGIVAQRRWKKVVTLRGVAYPTGMERRSSLLRHLTLTYVVCAALTSVPIVAAVPGMENHLQGNSSPYLRKASTQPVDWYPWGDEAWSRARKLDRPVLLDLGADWCAWCHRMDQESYTNPGTAAYINDHFVAIKVDYDRQPELVRQLQRAQAYLNLPSGLPMVSYMTPDGKIYSGNAFLEAKAANGSTPFRSALESAATMYSQNRTEVEREGIEIKVSPDQGGGKS
jgi:hypothetical protein